MKAKITPSKAFGRVSAPPSKSLAHRALICGALSKESVIDNIAFSKDISATIGCLKSLGAKVEVNNNSVKIGGFDPFNIPDNTELFCDESGSTLRFMLPFCLLSGKSIFLKGAKRLFERPLDIYESICREQGLLFEKSDDSVKVCGKLKSGNFRIPGDISSQFITGLLFVLPLLDGVSIIEIIGKFESASYVDLTLSVLAKCGIKVTAAGNRFIVMGNQKYKSFCHTVEGDCSNAAFLDAFNYMGGNVEVNGINANTLQGDRVYKDIFLGLDNGVKQFDLSDCPDLAPISFAVAAVKGGANFTGTARLRIKESDRGRAMAEELKKFGVDVKIGDDHVRIPNSPLNPPSEIFCGHNDHRIVMSLAVLCTLTGGIIDGIEAVQKSYPDFFEVLKTLKIGVEIYED